MNMKKYRIKVNDNPYDVTVFSVDANGKAKVSVNGVERIVEIEECGEKTDAPSHEPVLTFSSPVVPDGKNSVETSGSGSVVTSPLPGVIIAVHVNTGDKVSAGDRLVTLEAMKMENVIEAECDGIVKSIHVQRGDSVLEGAKIVTIG